jgi:hypothetical protein
MDKVIRTQPFILLSDAFDINARIIALKSLFYDCESLDDYSQDDYNQEEEEEIFTWSIEDRVMKSLRSLITTYPGVLSIPREQIKASTNALRASGFTHLDVMQLVRRCPAVLKHDANSITLILDLLKDRCGLRKIDLIPFLNRYPTLLTSSYYDIQEKINYFYRSLGGTPAMLARCPAYLSFDLNKVSQFVNKKFNKNNCFYII